MFVYLYEIYARCNKKVRPHFILWSCDNKEFDLKDVYIIRDKNFLTFVIVFTICVEILNLYRPKLFWLFIKLLKIICLISQSIWNMLIFIKLAIKYLNWKNLVSFAARLNTFFNCMKYANTKYKKIIFPYTGMKVVLGKLLLNTLTYYSFFLCYSNRQATREIA